MGFIKKLGDVARAKINAFLDRVEDQNKLKDQLILDAKASKQKAEKLLIQARAAVKLAYERKKSLILKAQDLKSQAEQFLQEGNEDKAKDALSKKQKALEEERFYDEQIKTEEKTMDIIKRGLSALDEKLQKIQSSASIERSQSVLEKEDAFQTFSRMEEKIDMAEQEVLALQELLTSDEKEKTADLPAAFDKHSDPIALEKELAAMKKKTNR